MTQPTSELERVWMCEDCDAMSVVVNTEGGTCEACKHQLTDTGWFETTDKIERADRVTK